MGVTFAVFIVLAGIVIAVDPTYHSNENDWGNQLIGAWGLITFALWIPAGAGTTRQWLKARHRRQSTALIDETIRDSVRTAGASSVEEAKQAAARDGTASRRLIEQRARRVQVEHLVKEGSGELASYYPGLPRSVKRVANRHYLLASVAVTRHMVGGSPGLTPQHLGKWAVLMERWPELAEQIILRPALAGELEQRAGADRDPLPGPRLAELLPEGVSQPEQLVRLLRDPISLASVADRLVFALPAH